MAGCKPKQYGMGLIEQSKYSCHIQNLNIGNIVVTDKFELHSCSSFGSSFSPSSLNITELTES